MKGEHTNIMRKVMAGAVMLISLICASGTNGAEGREITSVNVSGNQNISSEYILNVAKIKPGMTLSRDMILSDIETIYNQGFISFVDADISD